MTERDRALAIIWFAYAVAIAAGAVTLWLVPGEPLWRALVADVVATIVIWLFSRAYRNSSFYDAYWSVIPPLLGFYWWWAAGALSDPRAGIVLALVCFWAVRLTYNWAHHWTGLQHEDWRYPMVRERHPRMALFTDFFGIHLFPTIQVFLGCLPLYAAVSFGGPLNWLDAVAIVVTLGAILIEMIADIQLRGFLKTAQPGEVIRTGLWGWSRHPNYFGEISFWVGLMLFGLAAYPEGWWWLILGAIAMTVMFATVSIPMMEKRSLERRPAYAEVMRDIPMLVPRPPRR